MAVTLASEDAEAPQHPVMYVLDLPNTKRAKYLRALASFCRGSQHDHLRLGWDGVPRDPGVGYLWERLRPQGFVPTNALPYGDRKPDAAYPLPRQVRNKFTELLVGQGRHPNLSVPSDPDTQDFLDVVNAVASFWDTLVEARDGAGDQGSAAFSQGVVDGKPVSEYHDTADLWVKRWAKSDEWKPAEVVEQILVEVEEMDEETGKVETVKKWRTRLWDETFVYEYDDVPEDWNEDDDWKKMNDGPRPIPIALDPDGLPRVYEHHAGRCPVIWLQSTRNAKSPEGMPDNDGAFHLGDKMDRLQSMIVRASIANVDPTLVYLDERLMHRGNPLLRKGWGQVIRGSEKATVKFLETSGASIEMGWKSLHNLRDEYLQTVGCVIVDPQNAGTYKSGEALQILWRPMEAACNRKRIPLSSALQQSGEVWLSIGGSFEIASLDDDPEDLVSDKPVMLLPPKVEQDKPDPPEPGEIPDPSPPKPKLVTHTVGKGRYIKIAWPPYHVPTATQLQQFVTALVTAVGQKAILSQETAVTLLMGYLGEGDAADELRRLLRQQAQAQAQFAQSMFADEEANEFGKKNKAEEGESVADREGKKSPDKGMPSRGGPPGGGD